MSRQTLGLTEPPIQWQSRALSLEVKQLGCEAQHSSLSYIFMVWSSRSASCCVSLYFLYCPSEHNKYEQLIYITSANGFIRGTILLRFGSWSHHQVIYIDNNFSNIELHWVWIHIIKLRSFAIHLTKIYLTMIKSGVIFAIISILEWFVMFSMWLRCLWDNKYYKILNR
jgi:hypothetical protein